jgi:von Willebrand factor type D domain
MKVIISSSFSLIVAVVLLMGILYEAPKKAYADYIDFDNELIEGDPPSPDDAYDMIEEGVQVRHLVAKKKDYKQDDNVQSEVWVDDGSMNRQLGTFGEFTFPIFIRGMERSDHTGLSVGWWPGRKAFGAFWSAERGDRVFDSWPSTEVCAWVKEIHFECDVSHNVLKEKKTLKMGAEFNGEVIDQWDIKGSDGTQVYQRKVEFDPAKQITSPTTTFGFKALNTIPPGKGSIDIKPGTKLRFVCHGDVHGDPHFLTWAGKKFDFQGVCDLVLIDNPFFDHGLGMYVHARTKFHDNENWSAFAGLAVKIGDDVLEVHGEDPPMINGREVMLDVENGKEFAFPMSIGGYSLTVQQLGPHSRHHIIHLGHGQKIVIKNFKEFVDFEVEEPQSHQFAGAIGLLGSFSHGNNAPRGDRMGKANIEDADAFGQEWQVRDTDPQLFHRIEEPQYPAKCRMPKQPTASVPEPKFLRAVAASKNVSTEDAEKACADAEPSFKESCIEDVLDADDVAIATAYA